MLRATWLLLTTAAATGLDVASLPADAGGDGVLLGPAPETPVTLMPKRSFVQHPEFRHAADLPTDDLPTSFDWRDVPNVVTRVKNQGSVGSCWSFSTTGNIEGQHALATNTSLELSEEFLVDCDSNDCSVFGGFPYTAFEYIMARGGIPSEAARPYCVGGLKGVPVCYPCMADKNKTQCGEGPEFCNKTWTGKQCASGSWSAAASLSSWVAVSKDEDQIAAQLQARGPLSVLLDATMLQYVEISRSTQHLGEVDSRRALFS
jgi:cathepsin F